MVAETVRKARISAGVLVFAWLTSAAGAQDVPPAAPSPGTHLFEIPPGALGPAACPAPAPSRPGWFGWWQRGCHWARACCVGFPEEFEARPLGAAVGECGRTQVANAEAAQLVLYRADFVEGSYRLTPRGRERFCRILNLLPQTFTPLVIERSPCAPDLDEARKLVVVHELGRCGFAVPPERVVIGTPPAVGLSGVEALIIYNGLLSQTQAARAAVGGAAGGAGGFGFGFGAGTRTGPP
jgi:hypothetical protein